MRSLRWTSHDIEMLPDDGKRYEIVDGELYVSTQPHSYHQLVCSRLITLLNIWSGEAGEATGAPGLIFSEDNDVAPDVIWASEKCWEVALQPDGKLHTAPELVVEVLSPGGTNERRDREFKLMLYSRRGVLEYWIVNWQERRVEVYRRVETALTFASTLYESDTLQSPFLPEFTCPVNKLFKGFRS